MQQPGKNVGLPPVWMGQHELTPVWLCSPGCFKTASKYSSCPENSYEQLLKLATCAFICLSRRVTVMSMWQCPETTCSGCSNSKVRHLRLECNNKSSRLCFWNKRIVEMLLWYVHLYLACRFSAGPGHNWSHTMQDPSTGWRRAWWHHDLQHG